MNQPAPPPPTIDEIAVRVSAGIAAVTAAVLLTDIVDGVAVVVAGGITAAVAGAVTIFLLATRRLGRVELVATAALGVALAATVATIAAPAVPADDRGLVANLVDAVVSGWSHLFTAPVPAPATPRMLVPVVIAVWIAVMAAHALAARRPARRHHVNAAAPMVPLLALFVGATIVAGQHQFLPVAAAAMFVVAGAGVVRSQHRALATASASVAPTGAAASVASSGLRPSRGPLAAGAGIVAVAVITGVLASAAFVGAVDSEPFDLRDRLVPPVVAQDALNPLELMSLRRAVPDQPMFVVESPFEVSTRLVALEEFDGARWTTVAAYERVGSRINLPERRDVSRTDARIDVVIDQLDGPWLPSIADPRSIVGVDALVDPASGSLISAAASIAGLRYRLDAVVTAPDLTQLQLAPASIDDPRTTTVPVGLPDPLRQMADVATAGATSPLAQAVLLERYLRLNYTVDDRGPGGQSYRQLVEAFAESTTASEEQFAGAFAVLGRTVGLPTRVVVGFGPGTEIASGSFQVRSGDVRAWPEVFFDGAGWVAFDPVPPRADDAAPATNGVGEGGTQEIIVRSVDDDLPAASESSSAPSGSSTATTSRDWGGRLLLGLLVAGVVAGLGACVVVMAKHRRTRRRRTAVDPRQRVFGAWHDVLDRFMEVGDGRPESLTVEQVIEHDPDAAAALVALHGPVNRALYAPRADAAVDSTDGTGSIEDRDAEQAWRARDRYVLHLRQHASRPQRVRRSLDYRCLLHRWEHPSHDRSTP